MLATPARTVGEQRTQAQSVFDPSRNPQAFGGTPKGQMPGRQGTGGRGGF